MKIHKSVEKCKLVLLDPGLTNSSGHHFSTAELLLDKLAKAPINVELTILGGFGDWREKISSKYTNVTIKEFFSSNFYQFHTGIENLARINSYISKLSFEYQKVIEQEIDTENKPRLFFCHTLDWEHLIALSYAINFVRQKIPSARFLTISCMMYSTGADYLGNIIDIKKYLVSRLALRLAQSVQGLSIYASHFELMQAINLIDSQSKKIECSPCFIADWKSSHRINIKREDFKKVLLYAGDAKESKGFHLLPELVRSIQHKLQEGIKLIIQFTCAEKTSASLSNAAAELIQLAQGNNQIILLTDYLSDDMLAELLSGTDIFLFNYSTRQYANNSSGFLWHLAWHGVQFVTFSRSWITREADRLGISFHLIEQNELSELINSLSSHNRNQSYLPTIDGNQQDYRHTLFREPIEWLSHEWAKFDE